MHAAETEKYLLQAGAAQVDITPQPGIPLTGFIARLGPSTAAHDPLFARALALAAGPQQALLISCDLLALDAPFVAAVRADIRAATNIPEKNILIACTHTHSGPATIFLRDCGEVDAAYQNHLRLRLLEAAQAAVKNLRPAAVGVGRGHSDWGVVNRRQPGEPVDSEVGVVSIRDAAGQPVAVLVNYTCHPVCLDHTNRALSADYPGVLARLVHEQTGAVVLFTNGADGDINPERMGSVGYAEALGRAIAAETLRVLNTLQYRSMAALHIASEMLNLPLNPLPDQEELQALAARYQQEWTEALASGEVVQARMCKAMLGWVEATAWEARNGHRPTHRSAELQCIRLGDAVLVGVPGELFSEMGKQMKTSAAAGQAIVVGYANDDVGYIAPRSAYARGGYEIEEAYRYYGDPAALAPEAGEQLLQAAARLLQSLGRDAHSGGNA